MIPQNNTIWFVQDPSQAEAFIRVGIGECSLDVVPTWYLDAQQNNGLSIIRVSGVLSPDFGIDTTRLVAVAREHDQSPATNGILFIWDSPGGEVTGLPEAANALRDLRKPTASFTSRIMTSGAYWLAAAADRIYASPSSLVGSIGAYILHIDYSGMIEKAGVKITAIKAGEDKLAASEYFPLDERAAGLLQQRVDRARDEFVSFISDGRNISRSALTGWIFDGSEAINLGLIDQLVPFEQDAIVDFQSKIST